MFRISVSGAQRLSWQTWGYYVFGAAIALSFWHIFWQGDGLINGNGFALLWRFLQASVQPDLSADFLNTVATATLTTFAYALCGTFLSLSFGFIGGLLSAKIVWQSLFPQQSLIIWQSIRSVLAIPRAIHEVVWGLILINVWGLDSLVALGAIALPFGAIVAKVFAEILDETPRQGFDALRLAGVHPSQALLYGLFPQALFNLLSYGFYRFECSLRAAAVLGIIGAGGLGYEIFLSLQSVRYEQLWTLFYALIMLNALVDWSSGFLRRKLGCTSRLDLNTKQYRVNVQKRTWLFGTMCGAAALVSWGFWFIRPDWSRLWSQQTSIFIQDITAQLAQFTVDQETLKNLFWLSIQTLEMSILAIALAGVGGFILAFCVAEIFRNQQSRRSPVAISSQYFSRLILLICRGIPAPIWALVVLFVFFPGILPGAIALGLHNLGVLGRLMTEVIENLEREPIEALSQLGSPSSSVFLYGVVPLTLPNFIAYTFYRWEVCLRETVIVGLVGAGGLGRLLTEQLSSFDYAGVLFTLVCFLLLTQFVDQFSTLLRRKLAT
ncbi:binding-protein-dependent transport systems inner membrane component [[Leptolyngbya] sp. PCC 7376]|uniref:PhnE/PtxC family ABC transporter permease n=1 Tax=[Leptolyngbya] sp. PCC 7376 TaxID=111781 RepID=UPI00029F30D5|nr:ABC transporter permease subunit [[Leptolyngbya] sp. PCC 7376]AFY39200.1 binding-protein-dependent transport systems inner membrane component [[Leptolyngbya] sp. PCC 7376]